MEVLAGAASIVGIASLSLQVVESLKKLYEFWKDIEGAPTWVGTMLIDLYSLNFVLKDLLKDGNTGQNDAILEVVLESCGAQASLLLDNVEKVQAVLDRKSSRQKTWVLVKTVLRKAKLREMRENVQDMKSTLLLALQGRTRRTITERLDEHQETFSTIRDGLAKFGMAQTAITPNLFDPEPLQIAHEQVITAKEDVRQLVAATTNPMLRTFCSGVLNDAVQDCILSQGSQVPSDRKRREDSASVIRNDEGNTTEITSKALSKITPRRKQRVVVVTVTSSVRDINTLVGKVQLQIKLVRRVYHRTSENWAIPKTQYQSLIVLRLQPAQWLLKSFAQHGVEISLEQSGSTWKSTLDIFRQVPDDSDIFSFCAQGNVEAVKTLMRAGRASVMDQDSYGFTPLHFAAAGRSAEVCRFLLSHGADGESKGLLPDSGLLKVTPSTLALHFALYDDSSRVFKGHFRRHLELQNRPYPTDPLRDVLRYLKDFIDVSEILDENSFWVINIFILTPELYEWLFHQLKPEIEYLSLPPQYLRRITRYLEEPELLWLIQSQGIDDDTLVGTGFVHRYLSTELVASTAFWVTLYRNGHFHSREFQQTTLLEHSMNAIPSLFMLLMNLRELDIPRQQYIEDEIATTADLSKRSWTEWLLGTLFNCLLSEDMMCSVYISRREANFLFAKTILRLLCSDCYAKFRAAIPQLPDISFPMEWLPVLLDGDAQEANICDTCSDPVTLQYQNIGGEAIFMPPQPFTDNEKLQEENDYNDNDNNDSDSDSEAEVILV